MSQDYKSLRQQADKLYHRFNDSADDMESAGSVARELKEIVELFEMNKEPRTIDDRIKSVEHLLRGLEDKGPGVIDGSDLDELIDGYQDLREELHDLDNY